jgi:hypothetical protein
MQGKEEKKERKRMPRKKVEEDIIKRRFVVIQGRCSKEGWQLRRGRVR